MKRVLRGNKGFTLMEAMMAIAIMGIVGLGAMRMYADIAYAWRAGSAKMKISAEARLAMLTMRKFIHNCQGKTIVISRFNSNQPVNSYFSAIAGESVYATSTETNCGCGTSSDNMTVGTKGDYVQVYQNGRYLIARRPVLGTGIDWNSTSSIQSHISYQYVTLSSNLDNITFTLTDSSKGNVVYIAAKFSRAFWADLTKKPPAELMLKEAVVIKHPHSGGYYAN